LVNPARVRALLGARMEVDEVTTYIANQTEHHRVKSFEEEFRSFLKRYKIEFDERYVWDLALHFTWGGYPPPFQG
jgi:hypothetical protein